RLRQAVRVRAGQVRGGARCRRDRLRGHQAPWSRERRQSDRQAPREGSGMRAGLGLLRSLLGLPNGALARIRGNRAGLARRFLFTGFTLAADDALPLKAGALALRPLLFGLGHWAAAPIVCNASVAARRFGPVKDRALSPALDSGGFRPITGATKKLEVRGHVRATASSRDNVVEFHLFG